MKNHWYWVFGILLLELLLAYAIPTNILSSAPFLSQFVDVMRHMTSGIDYFTPQTVQHPDVARLYLAITLVLVIPKVTLIFLWLNSSQKAYSALVISPLTKKAGQSVGEFVIEPMLAIGQKIPEKAQRSMFSRVVWSSSILILGALFLWVLRATLYSNSGQVLYGAFSRAGFAMWSGWSLKMMTLMSFYFAVCICIIRDYSIVIRGFLKHFFVQAS